LLIKTSGRRESYNREKLKKGILAAIRKRPIAVATVDSFIEGLERKLYEANYKEIPTREIGDRVLDFLRKLDPVAYLRYASVYHNYSLEDMEKELRSLNVP
jgi:transcriptional repressor NrdR